MPRKEYSILVKLLKSGAWGESGKVVRVGHKDGMKLCERGEARVHEWKPPVRKPVVDVRKGGAVA